MLKIFVIILLLISTNVIAKGRIKLDTTPQNDSKEDSPWTLNTELDYYHIPNQVNQNTGVTNPTDTYYFAGSLGYTTKFGTTISINTSNAPIAGGGAQNIQSLSGIMLSQNFIINKYFDASIGTQNMTVFFGKMRLYNFDYSLLTFKANENISFHFGGYYASKALTLTSNTLAYTGGVVIKLDKFNIEGDWFADHTNVSGGNINLFYKNYYVGAIIPAHNSGNEFAGVGGYRMSF